MSESAVNYRERLDLAARIQARLGEYAWCLDNDCIEDWPGFFTERCLYKVTSAENWKKGLPIALIYCDSRAMLVDRVNALRHANIYEEHAYRHVLSPTVVRAVNGAEVEAHTGFMVVRTMREGDASVFATGQYVDRLVLAGGGEPPLLREKVVVCDSGRIDTLLALPL